MEYTIFRMEFPVGVHFGERNLEDAEYTFGSDTLFSALCQEAMKYGEDKLQWLVDMAKSDQLRISDGMPTVDGMYYIPKPMVRVETEKVGDSKVKKAFKKLTYLPVECLEQYLEGDLYVEDEIENFSQLGSSNVKTVASVRGEDETKPYRVGVYSFNEGNGLYILVGYEGQDVLEQLRVLMTSLSFSGLGGKRYAGLGRFVFEEEEVPEEMQERLCKNGNMYMTLSVSLPIEDELEDVMKDSRVLLAKRSGFVASPDYAEEFLRKKDLYVFQAGSCVKKKYKGDVYDVSNYGSHAVYRYAKPIFLEVTV